MCQNILEGVSFCCESPRVIQDLQAITIQFGSILEAVNFNSETVHAE